MTSSTASKSLTQLVLCAILIGLATVLGMFKIFHLPLGGSITMFSLLAATLCGYYCGTVKGIVAGLSLGLLNFILGGYVLHPVQVALDYFLAYGALGLSGLTSKTKNGLTTGFLIGVSGRFLCSFLSGWIFYGEYAPEGMNAMIYSFLYQLSYLGVEAFITVIIINIPAVKNSLQKLKAMI
jgi:thiamine transporter